MNRIKVALKQRKTSSSSNNPPGPGAPSAASSYSTQQPSAASPVLSASSSPVINSNGSVPTPSTIDTYNTPSSLGGLSGTQHSTPNTAVSTSSIAPPAPLTTTSNAAMYNSRSPGQGLSQSYYPNGQVPQGRYNPQTSPGPRNPHPIQTNTGVYGQAPAPMYNQTSAYSAQQSAYGSPPPLQAAQYRPGPDPLDARKNTPQLIVGIDFVRMQRS